MPANVREQIQQLTEAFDAYVEDVTVDEILRRSAVVLADDRVHQGSDALARNTRGPRRARALGVAAAVALVVGLVGALGFINNGGSDTANGSETSVGSFAPVAASSIPTAVVSTSRVESVGPFVWPAPARGFTTLDELIEAFSSEVLDWPTVDIDGDTTEAGPQGFALVNTTSGARVQMIAAPAPEGWGFVQVGSGLEGASIDDGTVVIKFAKAPAVTSSLVSVRLAGGEIQELTTASGEVHVPGIGLERLVSVLVVGRDDQGAVVSVVGGQFFTEGTHPTVPGSGPSTTVFVQAPNTTVDPLVYAGTETWLPRWPSISVSDPPALTSGYGMQPCDSGYGTKILRLDSPTDSPHAYSGTLCVFVELAEPRADAVVACATSTAPYNYARCARRTDQTETAGGGVSVSATATAAQQDGMRPFPSATATNQPEVFDVAIGAAANASAPVVNGRVSVSLQPVPRSAEDGVDPPGVCFIIELDGATADGCVGRSLLATGLAYGAFRDGEGPIELLGIVPDEVTMIDINGTIVRPVGNVWHHTLDADAPAPRITAWSADGRSASTL
jgi:hypothetical protein